MEKVILFTLIVMITVCGTLCNPIGNSTKKSTEDGCVCDTYTCGCCVTLFVPEIGLNDSSCIKFGYLPSEYGVFFSFTVDSTVVINETISLRSPIPICFPVPVVEDVIDFCVHFTNLDVTNSTFSGCVNLELRALHIFVLEELPLGCFKLGSMASKDAKVMRDVIANWAKLGAKELLSNHV